MKKYVLDACALIALIQNEDGADVVEGILLDAINGHCTVSMHRLNLLEVYYGYLRSDGKAVADEYLSAVEGSCINIAENFPRDLMVKAGEIKVAHRLSLADAVAVAHAITEQSYVVTSDHHELDSVDKSGDADVFWIR